MNFALDNILAGLQQIQNDDHGHIDVDDCHYPKKNVHQLIALIMIVLQNAFLENKI